MPGTMKLMNGIYATIDSELNSFIHDSQRTTERSD